VWVAPPVLPPHLSFTPSPPLHAAAFGAQRTEYTQKGRYSLFPSPPPRPPRLHTLELCERHTLLMPLPAYIHSHTLIKTRCACFLCRRKKEACPPLACFLTPPSLRRRYHSPHSLSPFHALSHPLTAPNTFVERRNFGGGRKHDSSKQAAAGCKNTHRKRPTLVTPALPRAFPSPCPVDP